MQWRIILDINNLSPESVISGNNSSYFVTLANMLVTATWLIVWSSVQNLKIAIIIFYIGRISQTGYDPGQFNCQLSSDVDGITLT